MGLAKVVVQLPTCVTNARSIVRVVWISGILLSTRPASSPPYSYDLINLAARLTTHVSEKERQVTSYMPLFLCCRLGIACRARALFVGKQPTPPCSPPFLQRVSVSVVRFGLSSGP